MNIPIFIRFLSFYILYSMHRPYIFPPTNLPLFKHNYSFSPSPIPLFSLSSTIPSNVLYPNNPALLAIYSALRYFRNSPFPYIYFRVILCSSFLSRPFTILHNIGVLVILIPSIFFYKLFSSSCLDVWSNSLFGGSRVHISSMTIPKMNIALLVQFYKVLYPL